MDDKHNVNVTRFTLSVATEIYLRALDRLGGPKVTDGDEYQGDMSLLRARADLFLARVNACSVKGDLK